MSALGGINEFQNATPVVANNDLEEFFSVDETYWGYIVQSREKRPPLLAVAQGLSWIAGTVMVTSAIGLAVLPGAMLGLMAFGMKLGLASVVGGIGGLFLWYATRGHAVEVHIDTRSGEVREIVRNRAGKPTLIGRYGFDSIGNVILDPKSKETNRSRLFLRYGKTPRMITVASGPTISLEYLRDRLCRDVLIDASARFAAE